jgi:MFS family permease
VSDTSEARGFDWVLGIGVFGLPVGSINFRWVGDRIGRKMVFAYALGRMACGYSGQGAVAAGPAG